MRVAVAAGGRFHVLDLARELHALGHEVTFYSYLPRARASRFGLPAQCHVSLFPLMAPILAAERLAPGSIGRTLSHARMRMLDRLVARLLRPCDVLVAMSGMFVATLRAAKQRYAATVILERGSRHILSQDRILRDMPGGEGADAFSIPRELTGYDIANFISVPSRHVARSFVEFAVPERKLLVNPYGCDLSMFPPTVRDGERRRTILFVGTWSRRKGCDVLLEAWRRLDDVRLVHVGPVGDLPLPSDEGFTHVAAVPQQELSRFYAAADVFVLASREEGLALVQAQALASGLPIVCTTRTGGADLRDLVTCHGALAEVEPDDPTALAAAIAQALDRAEASPAEAPRRLADDLRPLSWRAYGERYDRHLRETVLRETMSACRASPQ
jgi:glycosyltransferase involved in cell wall biosynthesis